MRSKLAGCCSTCHSIFGFCAFPGYERSFLHSLPSFCTHYNKNKTAHFWTSKRCNVWRDEQHLAFDDLVDVLHVLARRTTFDSFEELFEFEQQLRVGLEVDPVVVHPVSDRVQHAASNSHVNVKIHLTLESKSINSPDPHGIVVFVTKALENLFVCEVFGV